LWLFAKGDTGLKGFRLIISCRSQQLIGFAPTLIQKLQTFYSRDSIRISWTRRSMSRTVI